MAVNNLKRELFQLCVEFIDNKHKTVINTITELENSLQAETKSSAGDKHETGRAMVQLEREKLGSQLANIQRTKQLLNKINIEKQSDKISLGSLVFTSNDNYFISISAGKLQLENNIFYAVSVNSPIGNLLLGKSEGDKVSFRGQFFLITKIL